MEEFKKLGLSDNAIKALEKKGFTNPTTIQKKVIPVLLEGVMDVVAQSQTGTGKTAGFALPMIEKINPHTSGKNVSAIVLCPTRELAIQVAKEIDSLKGKKDIKVLAVYGGSPINPQRQKLNKGINIVVGTPGRVMDLQRRKSLSLSNIQFAVLDEADEMLNMGFVEDIEEILKSSPKDKKMLLFSATMPKAILNIAKRYMRKYEFFEVKKADITIKTIEQLYYDINAKDRVEGLRRILDYYSDFYGIIFCNTRATVDSINNQLSKLGYDSAALHGDITQSQREKILQQFRDRRVKVLVATDVAARGIDVNNLTHVINFSLPQSPEGYVHRIGRTGRAGKRGISITFVIPSEQGKLKFVERIVQSRLKKRSIPTSKEIVERKRSQVKEILNSIMENSKPSQFDALAEELLSKHHANDVVAAVLKYSFENELSKGRYKDISEPRPGKSGPKKGSGSRGPRGRDRFSRDHRSNSRTGNSRTNRRDKPRFKRDRSGKKTDSSDKRKRYGDGSGSKGFGKKKFSKGPDNRKGPKKKFSKKSRQQEVLDNPKTFIN